MTGFRAAPGAGVAAVTLRVWERRYGFPRPGRTSSGRRRYHADDIEAVRRVLAYRDDGLSVAAAISQTLRSINATAAPSLVSAVIADSRDAPAQVLRKSTLSALSRAIEHEALIRADRPVVIASFQREGFYRVVERRYRRLACQAEIALVLADFPTVRHPAGALANRALAYVEASRPPSTSSRSRRSAARD